MKIPLPTLIKRTTTRRKRFVFANPEPRIGDRATLFRIYMRVVKHWVEARDRLLAAYERELAVFNNDSLPLDRINDSISDLQSSIDGEGGWFNRVLVELRAEIQAWAVTVEAWQRGKWRGAVLSASGVDLDTMLYAGDVAQTLDSVIAQNVALIKDVNAQQQERIAGIIFRGLNQRLPARDVAKQLQEVATFGRNRALLIASDQLQKATAALAVERQYQAGLGGRYEWRHSGKLHARPWHKARNGKIFDDNAKEGSEEYVAPDDRPGVPIRCGCRRLGVLELDNFDENWNLIE